MSYNKCTQEATNKCIATTNLENYNKCIDENPTSAFEKFNYNKRKLCPEGYCTAKTKYEVYPSAYANLYASGVCKGTNPNITGEKQINETYMARLNKRKKSKNSLIRWVDEQWVNVCKSDPNGPGGYAVCGSGQGVGNLKQYPYCRPLNKLEGTTVKIVSEFSVDELRLLCNAKQELPQGVNGKPTRIFTTGIVEPGFLIPPDVAEQAKLGLKLKLT